MQVNNPKIPFGAPIEGRLVPGSKITIAGWPLERCTAIRVNLRLGPDKLDEIAVHFSFRFRPSEKVNVAVRNSLTSAGWGVEERDTPVFPFLIKQPYKLEILCERARFRVFVDDHFMFTYTHRLPLAYISYLEIEGDTEVSYVGIPRVPASADSIGLNTSKFTMNNLSIKDEDYEENN